MKKPIVIGVDIRDLRLAKTGTKTYLEELCAAFKSLGDDQVLFRFLDTSIPVYSGKGKLGKYAEHLCYQLWKQIGLPVKAWLNRCDVVFCTDNFVPLLHLGYQTVPVFHDAFFFENPEHYGKLWLKLYHLTAIPAAKRSAFIVTPTFFARQKIHQYTHIPLKQLEVVYEGPKTMQLATDNNVLQRFNLEQSNYILHVGAMFKRKNIPALIEAFSQLKMQTNSTVKLVLAGSAAVNSGSNDFELILKAIQNNRLENEIVFTGYLSDTELAGIYASALMYVFPSVNEGFGIPILEAFSHNVPVLVADNTCLPEVGANAVLTFDPFNAADICSKMKMMMEDGQLRNKLIAQGRIRLQEFSWKKAALELVALFKLRHNKDLP